MKHNSHLQNKVSEYRLPVRSGAKAGVPSPETALYLGRFQPLPHIGHARVLKELFAKHEKVIIVLGSANKEASPEHLLSAAERQEVLETLLKSLGIEKERYEIIPVPDIDCYPKYVKHLESFVPHFDIVYSGNPIVQELFRERGYRVEGLGRYGDISGTKLRKLMIEDKPFKKYLPEACLPFLEKFKIVKRLQGYEDRRLKTDDKTRTTNNTQQYNK